MFQILIWNEHTISFKSLLFRNKIALIIITYFVYDLPQNSLDSLMDSRHWLAKNTYCKPMTVKIFCNPWRGHSYVQSSEANWTKWINFPSTCLFATVVFNLMMGCIILLNKLENIPSSSDRQLKHFDWNGATLSNRYLLDLLKKSSPIH